MDIKLIATDLDGTALVNSNEISPRLDRALTEAAARGVYVVPVTGRQYKMLPPCLPKPWTKYAILCNGAETRAIPHGALLTSHYLTPDLLLTHLPALLALGIPLELSGGGRLHTTKPMLDVIMAAPLTEFHKNFVSSGVILEKFEDFLHNLPYPIDKINLPYIANERRQALTDTLPALPFSGVWSGPNNMEVTHYEATKGKALATLCRRLGIDLKHTMALGDSGNDVPMLTVAGLSVAMGNAPDFVKAAAQTVTSTNTEDGAAIAIERYVLNT